jgi:hypothetical protein
LPDEASIGALPLLLQKQRNSFCPSLFAVVFSSFFRAMLYQIFDMLPTI